MPKMSEPYTEATEAYSDLEEAMKRDPIKTMVDGLLKGEGPVQKVIDVETRIAYAKAESSASDNAPAPHPSDTWREYWTLCLAVVGAASEVAAKDKLLMNFRDPENSHKVRPIINKHFHGDVSCLKDARMECIRNFFYAVDQVNWYARKHDLAQASAMKLMGMLEDKNARKRFRHHIQRHIESDHPPFELDELPNRDFRKPC